MSVPIIPSLFDITKKLTDVANILVKNLHKPIESEKSKASIKDLNIKGFGGHELRFKQDSQTKRIVYGVVYKPESIDAHGDFMNVAEIEQMSKRFMRLYEKNQSFIDNQHDFIPGAGEIVESWIIQKDDELFSEEHYIGAWAIGVKVLDDFLWKKILKKEMNAFSFAGRVDIGKILEIEIDKEDLEKYFPWLVHFDTDKMAWILTVYELINVRLLAVSIVDEGANLEPRFPLIKTKSGNWEQFKLNNFKDELKSKSVSKSFDSLNLDFNNIFNQKGVCTMDKKEIQEMIDNSLATVKEEVDQKFTVIKESVDVISQKADSFDEVSKNLEGLTESIDSLKANSEEITALSEKVTVLGDVNEKLKSIDELKESVTKVDESLTEYKLAFNSLVGYKEESDITEGGEPTEKSEIEKVTEQISELANVVEKIASAPNGNSNTQNSKPAQKSNPEDDELFEGTFN